ncbi:MAG TPA: pantoate--beta-alanine ligase [Parafilimonas sp.]|nr:pantoate--beta-alanine ligase [Parafilimonas sp.]
MILFKKANALTEHLQKLRNKNVSVGFVPTMGALHSGHISLITQAKKECDIVVCSIFVNPVQFNNKTDFEKYPITIENDILLLEENGTDILFLPSVSEVYPNGIDKLLHFDLDYLENILEGFYRPGHFQGVCNVIYNFLRVINPGKLFLGQKDYQQTLVLKKMMQFYFPSVKINIEETLREDDGLAMSSRNMRLSSDARKKATIIFKALQYIKQNIEKNNFSELKNNAAKMISDNGFNKIDYIEIANAETLLPENTLEKNKKLIVLAAAFIEDVRLIDNLVIN